MSARTYFRIQLILVVAVMATAWATAWATASKTTPEGRSPISAARSSTAIPDPYCSANAEDLVAKARRAIGNISGTKTFPWSFNSVLGIPIDNVTLHRLDRLREDRLLFSPSFQKGHPAVKFSLTANNVYLTADGLVADDKASVSIGAYLVRVDLDFVEALDCWDKSRHILCPLCLRQIWIPDVDGIQISFLRGYGWWDESSIGERISAAFRDILNEVLSSYLREALRDNIRDSLKRLGYL